MKPAYRPITIYRGDDYLHVVAFHDSAGGPVDKTGCTYTAQIRASAESTTVLATMVAAVDGPTGQVTLTLDDAVTATLVPGRRHWDLEELSATGIVTKLAGTADIIADVTRSGA